MIERTRRSALLINVMGYLDDEEILGAAPVRAFLDIDPGFGQIWKALGLHDLFRGHDRFLTVGGRIGSADCEVPTVGLDWIAIKPPVELTEWPSQSDRGSRFTSVASWRGAFGPLEYEGQDPRLAGARVPPLLRAARADTGRLRGRARHRRSGDRRPELHFAAMDGSWPTHVRSAGDPWSYRDYIQRSAAELMVAKNLYVETHSGWFSDRSACYLASGRPVLAQDTGLEGLLPTGEGLVTFSTLDEAVAGVEEISGDYERHSRAAREIAAEHFAAEQGACRGCSTGLGI